MSNCAVLADTASLSAELAPIACQGFYMAVLICRSARYANQLHLQAIRTGSLPIHHHPLVIHSTFVRLFDIVPWAHIALA